MMVVWLLVLAILLYAFRALSRPKVHSEEQESETAQDDGGAASLSVRTLPRTVGGFERQRVYASSCVTSDAPELLFTATKVPVRYIDRPHVRHCGPPSTVDSVDRLPFGASFSGPLLVPMPRALDKVVRSVAQLYLRADSIASLDGAGASRCSLWHELEHVRDAQDPPSVSARLKICSSSYSVLSGAAWQRPGRTTVRSNRSPGLLVVSSYLLGRNLEAAWTSILPALRCPRSGPSDYGPLRRSARSPRWQASLTPGRSHHLRLSRFR